MCKRNSPDENKASTGCVRATPQLKKKEKKKKRIQHGMCERNSPQKNEAITGYVRETPQVRFKPAWDV